MGFLSNLLFLGRRPSWKKLPLELQPLYRSFVENGLNPTATPYLPIANVVDPLRENRIELDLAASIVRSVCRTFFRAGYRLAASTDDARAGFLAPDESVSAVGFAARTLTRCALDTDLTFVAPGALAMFAGSRQSRPSIDLEQEGVRALRDLAIAEGLLLLGVPAPLRQRAEPVEIVERAVQVQLIGDFATYVSLLPDHGATVVRASPLQFFGPRAIVDGYGAGVMRGARASFVPIAMSGKFMIGVDALGSLGATGMVYAATRGRGGVFANSVGEFLNELVSGNAERRFEAALAAVLAPS